MTRLAHRFFTFCSPCLLAVFGNVEHLGATLPEIPFLAELSLELTRLINRDAGRIGLRAQPPS
jgi:hypothetical protein